MLTKANRIPNQRVRKRAFEHLRLMQVMSTYQAHNSFLRASDLPTQCLRLVLIQCLLIEYAYKLQLSADTNTQGVHVLFIFEHQKLLLMLVLV